MPEQMLEQSPKVSQKEINDIAWKACDTFRGMLDPAHYKDYILVMLFIKYMSDVWYDSKEFYESKYKTDKGHIKRALKRVRFIMPPGADFKYLYSRRDAENIGELINTALSKIEEANGEKLGTLFREIDFNSNVHLGQTKERNRRLKYLLNDFNNPRLDLRPSHLDSQDIIGNTYEYLISHFASDAGKKGGEFYTPAEVATLLAHLLKPKSGDRICDPACGSGSLLIRMARAAKEADKEDKRNYALFGQESNGSTWALCRMNMFLHGMDNARIEWGDTINNPLLLLGDALMKFNVVVANPPFSLDKWGADEAVNDSYKRFFRGIPPKSKGDYAFISHMVEIALAEDGRVGVVVPHGVLFRGGSEGKIRQKLVEENLLKAVIGLPVNIFFGTSIPAAILVFDKGKRTQDVLFIDASRDYQEGKNQNRLREEDIAKITKTFRAFKSAERYAYRATLKEIKANNFNLNIPRYVDTFVAEEEIDIAASEKEIRKIETELATIRKEMAGYLKELGYEA